MIPPRPPERVVKDRDRFMRFSPDRRAVLPPDTDEPVPFVATEVLVAERVQALLAADAAASGQQA